MVATTFWETFFLFLIFLPLAMIWAMALVDIFRRDDMGGWSKALWVVCIVVIPYLGTRPRGATPEERMAASGSAGYGAPYAPSSEVGELTALADLHERGKLTDSEFAAEKARLLGAVPA